MLKERKEAVTGVSELLSDGEAKVEAALAAIAKLAIAVPTARDRVRISMLADQDAMSSLGAAFAGLVTVRGHLVDTHHHLEALRVRFRLPGSDTGGGYQKPRGAAPRELSPATGEAIRAVA